ncbi:MAG: type II/IV secretion system protein [Phycisphaerae bacterium]|nr:type II/IV secretion system protein [Phycisphaerae bacterium]
MADLLTFLVEQQVIEAHQGKKYQVASDEPLYYRLLRDFPDKEHGIWQSLAEYLQVKLVDPHKVKPTNQLVRIVPARLAHEYSIVPLSLDDNNLEIAVADPQQFEKCQELSLLLSQQRYVRENIKNGLIIRARLALPGDIALMIKRLYGLGAETVEDMLDGSNASGLDVNLVGREILENDAVESHDDEAAIIKFVNQLLIEAVKAGASDIHLEPFENKLRVRYRIDGMLQNEPVPENIKHLEAAIISRIKIMANLDIAEKRLPQDGQIRIEIANRPIDIRVSILPTMFGQGLALRLLDRQLAFLNLNRVGMPDDYLELYRRVLGISHGVVLVTGPTGSGKTTTLYGSLQEINRSDRKILTVEDPIEYQLEGVCQIQVKPSIDLTFANVLRSILRHDPDIIMVGEIRDRDTAQIAVSAAMTGHLVFSTLHTNDATSAPARLMEMGVEPYLISSALEAVVAQRLVRELCSHCKKKVAMTDSSLGQDIAELNGINDLYESKGCGRCRHSGFIGRTAIFEMFTIDNNIRQMILNRDNAVTVKDYAIGQGMRTLHKSGLELVKNGRTSLAEIYRVAREERIEMKKFLD